jgi:pyruvate ferredoxin oxidoreductase delta subunit
MTISITPGLVARGGTSIDNHTGGWRTERPRFLWDACTGCDLCAVYCPEGIVHALEPKRYAFLAEYCKGCAICVQECPVDDIVMEAEIR